MDAKLCVVMPVYNEANIAVGVERTIAVLDGAGIPYEFILVDDGSTNDAWNQITDLARTHENVVGIALSRNFGKERALCAGLDHVTGACCVCIDSDMQHPPELIPEMYRLWKEEGYEVVEGVKQARGRENPVYGFFAKLFYGLLRTLSGIDLKNASDFRLLDRSALEAWRSMPERETFFRGMSSWIGFRRVQVPFEVAPREFGSSKWSVRGLFRLAFDAITAYSSAPLYLAFCFGLLFLLFTVGMLGQTLYMKLMGYSQDGFTTVIVLQLIIGSVLLVNLGIVGIYIKNIYEEIKQRPRYIVRRTTKDHMDRAPGGGTANEED